MARNLELPMTKGTFELRGLVSGTGREGFFSEGVTKNGNREYRSVRFGVEVEKGMLIFVELFDMQRDFAMFWDSEKKEAVKIPWRERKSFNKENCSIMGVGLALTQDEHGKNEVVYMTAFDGAEYISNHLRDGMSVFVRGDIEFNHFTGRDGNVVRNQRLVPKNIYLTREPIDFDDEAYEPRHKFTQDIVFDGIEKVGNKDAVVSCYFVNYNSVEQDVLNIRDGKLFNIFKSRLKPFDFISVHGEILTEQEVEEVQETESDVWGEENDMKKQRTPYHRVFVITGASGDTLDTEMYDEKSVMKALETSTRAEKAVEEFSDEEDDSWGEENDIEDEAW